MKSPGSRSVVEVIGRTAPTGEAAENAALNRTEVRSGKAVLDSVPPRLRVTTERRCNIRPRCVYCEWDWAKTREKISGFDATPERLRGLGAFYDLATEVVECSYGEPFLNPDLGAMIEDIDRRGKHFEMTSNGQVLSARRRQLVLGKRMALYVSLDAATAETYARYRNDGFDLLVENVRALCREKEAYGGRPTVLLSFVAMRSNIGEFEAFLDLAVDLAVDAVKVRALFAEGARLDPEVIRAGHAFRYHEERLDPETLEAFAATAPRVAATRGVPLYIDTNDFQRETHPTGGPLCAEPFETLYLLNRGLMPCCFGKEPLATLEGIAPEDMEDHLTRVWNGPTFRALRSALAAGRLPDSCRRTRSCPIVERVRERETAITGPEAAAQPAR